MFAILHLVSVDKQGHKTWEQVGEVSDESEAMERMAAYPIGKATYVDKNRLLKHSDVIPTKPNSGESM